MEPAVDSRPGQLQKNVKADEIPAFQDSRYAESHDANADRAQAEIDELKEDLESREGSKTDKLPLLRLYIL